MKPIAKHTLLVCLSFLIVACSSQQKQSLNIQRAPSVGKTIADFSDTAATTDLASFPIEQFTVSPAGTQSGLQVIFVSDKTIPMVTGSLLIPGGTLSDDPTSFGKVQALGSLLRAGGAGNLSANALDEQLQKMSATITSGAGPETITVSFSALTSDADTVFGLFKDVITKPKFEESRISLWKSQSIEEIRRRKDSPDTVAALSLKRILFGKESILGAATTSESVNAVSAPALKKLASERIGQVISGKNAVLVLSGDLTLEKAKQLAQDLSNVLPKDEKKTLLSQQQNFVKPQVTQPELVFVEQPLTQATVYMGALSPKRDPNEDAKIDLFNSYFGKGEFGSVLMKRVRTELGLAYGVFGAVSEAPIVSRSLLVVQTKSETTGDALKAMVECLEQVQAGNIEKGPLEEARRAELNAYPFAFESPVVVATRKAVQIIQGYPDTFDATYPKVLASADKDQIQQISQTYFDNKSFKAVVVGNAAALQSIKSKLSSFPAPFNSFKIREGSFTDQLLVSE